MSDVYSYGGNHTYANEHRFRLYLHIINLEMAGAWELNTNNLW